MSAAAHGERGRRLPIFFYGLFVDPVHWPATIERRPLRVARLNRYRLCVGARAFLWPDPATAAFGVVADLDHAELALLYAGPGLADYLPEAVVVDYGDGGGDAALTFNLMHPDRGAPNRDYARQLLDAAAALKLPGVYLAHIRAFC